MLLSFFGLDVPACYGRLRCTSEQRPGLQPPHGSSENWAKWKNAVGSKLVRSPKYRFFYSSRGIVSTSV